MKKKRFHADIDMTKVGKALADMLILDLHESLTKPTNPDFVLGSGFKVLQNTIAFLSEAMKDPVMGFPVLLDFINASELRKLKDTKFDVLAKAIQDSLDNKPTIN
jgi:hypothetical protein